jgi:MYXO-CTERM domain-containing protein
VANGALASLLAIFALFGDPGKRWEGVALVRVHSDEPELLEAARAIAIDEWTEGAGAAGSIDLAVPRESLGALELIAGDYELRTDDLARAVDEERDRLASRQLAPPLFDGGLPAPGFFDDFRDLEELEGAWAEIAEANPDLIARDQIGVSYEGRKLWVFEISTAPEDAPAVFLNFGQHAREWITPASATCFLSRLVEDYPTSNELQALFGQVRLYIVPLVNPDGYAYTWTDDRFWRKNRRPDLGVDLNRNWSVSWGEEPGSSSDPDSGNYRGTGPFSEPETAALRAFLVSHPNIGVHADIHSYSQLVLYPLSHLTQEVPEEQGRARAWAEEQAARMAELHGTEYLPLRGSDLYPATGVAMDWSFEELGTMSFTYELRPGTDIDFPDGFVLPPDEILPTCDEASTGIMALLEWAVDGGPEPVDPPEPNPPPEEEEGDAGEQSDVGDSEEGEVGSEGGRPNANEDGGSGPGCACSSEQGPSPNAAWLLMLGLLRRRRAPAR